MAPRNIEEELTIRLYRWSLNEWDREIACSFGTLKRVSHPLATRALRFLTSLDEDGQRHFSRAATKRFHPEAVEALSDVMTVPETTVLERWDAARRVLSPTDPTGAILSAIDRKRLVATLVRDLSFLGAREGLGGRAWFYQQRLNGWTLKTLVDAGGRTEHIAYRQDFGIEDGPTIRSMSLLSWLGLSSETTWALTSPGDIESAVGTVAYLCQHFADACSDFLRDMQAGGTDG